MPAHRVGHHTPAFDPGQKRLAAYLEGLRNPAACSLWCPFDLLTVRAANERGAGRILFAQRARTRPGACDRDVSPPFSFPTDVEKYGGPELPLPPSWCREMAGLVDNPSPRAERHESAEERIVDRATGSTFLVRTQATGVQTDCTIGRCADLILP